MSPTRKKYHGERDGRKGGGGLNIRGLIAMRMLSMG